MYHPHSGINDRGMLDHLTTSLTTIEGLHPGCGIVVCRDFNRMNLDRLTAQFKLKQIVNKPTRGDKTLDLIITNLPHLYDKDALCNLPPFGLSDHNVVIVRLKQRQSREGSSRKVITRRDTRPSRKAKFGCYFAAINWSIVDSAPSCEDKSTLLCDTITIGLDSIMISVRATVHNNDPPWITPEFKALIAKRQQAFHSQDAVSYRYYRNLVNRERNGLRGRFFESKVNHLKDTKPSQWWGVVKRIAGMAPTSDSVLRVEGLEHFPAREFTIAINSAFLEPMKAFTPLEVIPTFDANSDVLILSENDVSVALGKLNPRKASGPDDVSNWVLREYGNIFSRSITSVLNSSFAEQQLPPSWKLVDIVPLTKQKPTKDINKHLRPISLTLTISKVAEDFVVAAHVAPAVLKTIDPDQFGGIPKSSTVQALTSMLHHWTQASDGRGSAVRVVLFDYRKASNFIDQHLLSRKIRS